MRQVWAILTSATLVLAWGCDKSYEIRLDQTLKDRQYLKSLNDNLINAPTQDKFKSLKIFVRPPKNLQEAKTFLLPVPAGMKFDLDASFLEEGTPGDASQAAPGSEPPRPTVASTVKQSMHLLARVERQKNPAAKKAEPAAPATDFREDVLTLASEAYGAPAKLTFDKFKEMKKRNNTYRHHSFAVGGKTIQVYLFGTKTDPYEVALIFEYPSTEHSNLSSKIGLCLESFAVGTRADRSFSGGLGDEATPPGGPAPPPGVF